MSRRKKKNFLQRSYKSIILVLIIAALAGYWLNDADKKEIQENKEFTSESPYHILENNDSVQFVANIVLTKNRSILQIAKDYYKKEFFWPYIFNSNPDIDDILNLKSGTILKLPKLSEIQMDTLNPQSVEAAKRLGDSILVSIEKERKAKLEEQGSSDW